MADIRRMGISGDTMTLHFSTSETLQKAMDVLPAKLAHHELTVSDPASNRLFVPITGDETSMTLRNFLRDAGAPDAAIAAFSPHLSEGIARAQAAQALAHFLPITPTAASVSHGAQQFPAIDMGATVAQNHR